MANNHDLVINAAFEVGLYTAYDRQQQMMVTTPPRPQPA